MPQSDVVPYGQHPDQHVALVRADAPARGTIVLVRPLLDAGWNVANVEYRRGLDGPWPAALADVRAACALVAGQNLEGPLVAMGHSVGGELALLAGDPVNAVVALAPVTDAARTHAEHLGDGAAEEYFSASPAQDPGRYADASPIARLTNARSTLVVHGADDARVPVRHTLDYLVAAWEAGVGVTALLPDRLGHLEVIDPAGGHWATVLRWMDGIAAAGRHGNGSSTRSA